MKTSHEATVELTAVGRALGLRWQIQGTILVACIDIRAMTEVGNPIPENLIPPLSPLGWEHITFTGSYHWREHANDINVLRPLRTFKLLDKKRKTA